MNPLPDPPCIPDPGDRETEFSHGSILGIDWARPGNYEYDHQNGLNAGQHIGFQANLGLWSRENAECRTRSECRRNSGQDQEQVRRMWV